MRRLIGRFDVVLKYKYRAILRASLRLGIWESGSVHKGRRDTGERGGCLGVGLGSEALR